MKRIITLFSLLVMLCIANTAMALSVVKTTPANGESVAANKYSDMVFDIEFDQDITRIKRVPAVVLTETLNGSTTTVEPDDSWEAAVTGKTLRVWGADYDGYTMTYATKDGAAYKLVIPAGVIKGADGVENDEIVIEYICGAPAAKAPVMTASTPANGSEIASSKYANMKCVITFDQDVTVKTRTPSVVMTETLNGNTTTLEPESSWAAGVDKGNTLTVWGEDYDGYTMTYEAKAGATYTVSIPKGIVKTAEGLENEAFAVTWSVATPKPLKVVSTVPANGDNVEAKKYNTMAFDVVFDQTISRISRTPAVVLTETLNGKATTVEPEDSWEATVTGNSLRVWGADYDGYTMEYETKDGAAYKLVIPAGIVRTADGMKNDQITIEYTCGTPATPAPVMVSSTPANGSEIASNKYANMKCVVTFDQDVTCVKRTPAVVMKETLDGTTNVIEPENSWAAGVDKGNTLTVWGEDYDGYTMTYNAKAGATYTVEIPAGVVKNADNVENEAFTVTWTVAVPKPLKVVSTVPANGDNVEAKKYSDMAFDVVFDQDITRIKRVPAVILTETLKGNTTTIEPDDSWVATVTGKTLRVWGADYDEYTMTYETKNGAAYKLVIPAGVVKTADGMENEEITIEYSCGTSYKAGDVIAVAPFEFTVTEEGTLELTKAAAKDASGVKYTSYTIPSNVEGMDVTSIGESVFKWSDATQVVLPSTLKTIGKNAFASSALASIELPEGLEEIGDYAFNSAKFTTVNCPSTLKKIGSSAFFTCRQLETINLNEGLEEIGSSAFYHCEKLAAVAVPSTIKVLGAKAFLSCDILSDVTLPEGLKEIKEGTFNNCPKLASINIPSTVESIGTEAFLDCSALTSVELPASLKKMGTSVFAKTGVATITVAPENTFFSVKDGVLYSMKYINEEEQVLDKPYHLVYAAPMTGKSEVVVEDGCLGINGGAFWGSKVSKVTVPESLIAFDDYAFCQSSLSEINLTDNVLFIGEQAYASTMLTKVVVPSQVTFINDGAFAGCKQLQEVTLPASVTMIYNHAFHNSTNIRAFYCLGETAPEIDDVWETYDSPFFGISTSTPLYVPVGSSDSYKSNGWNEYFKIVEMDVTAIDNLAVKGNRSANDAMYSINGQRVSANHKGLVIKNGKVINLK